MAVDRLIEDLAVIQKLGNSPGVDDGLTTEEFKAKFDYAAGKIKEYLNNIIAPAIDAINSGAIVVSATKPTVYPVLWFKTEANSTSIVYIDLYGDQLSISPSVSIESVSGLSDMIDEMSNDINGRIDIMKSVSVSLPASGWTSSAPYLQTVSVDNMTTSWVPGTPTAIFSGTTENKIAVQDSLFCIGSIESGSGFLQFTCFEDKPETDLTIIVPGILPQGG